MKLKFAKNCLLAVVAGVISSAAVAQNEKAASLDELLSMVKSSKVAETKEHRKREAEFRKDKSQQASLLKKAESKKTSEEARSSQLEKTYADQEIKVEERRRQLDERMGSLKELFGHLTSQAGDLRSAINTSIVSAQLPERTEFIDQLIDKMSSNTQLPTIAEMERLWYETQRETVEAGRIVKFMATVEKPNGEQASQEVVRIGNYNMVSEGQYLTYSPESGRIKELLRQPSDHNASAAALQAATSGFTGVGIDPTGPSGGTYLAAMINSPSIIERWHQGGLVGYIISAVGAFAVLMALVKLLILSGTSAKVNAQLKAASANTNNPLGRILKIAEDNPGLDGETLELKLEEAILKERPGIESTINLLKIISMVAPLLGLLGTVVGMIITFQAITIFGAGDPKAMAGGISGALVTTVLGLVVAIPTVLLHTVVNGRAKKVLHILEEQSAGIIAQNAETKK